MLVRYQDITIKTWGNVSCYEDVQWVVMLGGASVGVMKEQDGWWGQRGGDVPQVRPSSRSRSLFTSPLPSPPIYNDPLLLPPPVAPYCLQQQGSLQANRSFVTCCRSSVIYFLICYLMYFMLPVLGPLLPVTGFVTRYSCYLLQVFCYLFYHVTCSSYVTCCRSPVTC